MLNKKNLVSFLWILFVISNSCKIGYFFSQIVTLHIAQIFLFKVFVCILLIFITINIISKFRHFKLLFILFYVCQFSFILVNLIYYKFFNSYLHIYGSLTIVGEGIRALNALSTLNLLSYLWTLADLPVVIVLLWIKSTQVILFKRTAYISVGILIMMEIVALITKNSIVYKLNSKLDSETAIVKRYGLIINNVVDFYRFSNEKNVISSLQFGDFKTIAKPDDPRNVVIIQMESIFSKVIETKYKGKPIAEFLDSISHCSIYYPYTLTFHPNGTTDCEFTVINSVIPPESFPGIKLSTYNYNNSFLKVLTKANYDVKAFHNNNRSYFNRETAYPKMGFLHFYDMYEMNLKEEGWGASDGSLFNFMTDYIQSQKNPFCDYLITMSTHSSYENVRRYYNNVDYDDIAVKTTRNFYNSVTYLDGQLKMFVKNIQDSTPNTTILIYGDHPSFVNDSNLKMTVVNQNNCLLNYVPLIILTPEKLQKYDTTFCASLLDVAPTILSITSGGVLQTQGVNLLDVHHSMENDWLLIKNKKYSRKELMQLIK